MKKNLILFFFSTFLIILLLEISVKIFYPQNFGWYAERDVSGLNILRKNIKFYHRLYGRNIEYKFGKYNERQTTEYTKKDKVLILGDSFTFGWLVKDKNTYVHHLQKHFLNYYFINSSVPGWGTASQVRYVENYCQSIKPKKIIIMINTDDIGRAWWSKLYKFKIIDLTNPKNNYLTPINREQLNYNSKFYKIPFYKFLIKNSHLFVLTRNAYEKIKNKEKNFKRIKINKEIFQIPDDRTNLILDKTSEANMLGKMLFLKLKKISNLCGAELIVIYSGWYDFINNQETYKESYSTGMFIKNANKFFNDNNIKYYDFTSQMKDVHSKFYNYIIPYDYHPNEEGHKIISNNIIKYVKLD